METMRRNAEGYFPVALVTSLLLPPMLAAPDIGPGRGMRVFMTQAAAFGLLAVLLSLATRSRPVVTRFFRGGIGALRRRAAGTRKWLLLAGLGAVAAQGMAAPPVPRIAVSPTAIDFGTLDPGQSREARLVIKNIGDAGSVLAGTTFDLPAPVSIVLGGGNFALQRNESRVVQVRFQAGVAFTNPIRIDSNDPAQPRVAVRLTGKVNSPRITVTKIEWVGYDPGDGSTNYSTDNPPERGGGARIFAERNQPQGRSGDQLHDKILIKATLSAAPPGGTNVTVDFKVFDPDHYSADPAFDTNGSWGADNVVAGGAQDVGAVLKGVQINPANHRFEFGGNATSVTLVGDGATAVVFIGMEITARQPTNNFVVVGSTDLGYVFGVQYGSDGSLQNGGVAVPAAFRTPLLTVWRTLYAELDSMGQPIWTQGPAPSRIAAGRVFYEPNTLSSTYIGIDVPPHITPGYYQFQGGTIVLLRANGTEIGTFHIGGNYSFAPGARVWTLDLRDGIPVGESPTAYRNLDDDDVAHNVTAAEMRPDTRMWETRYDPACVRVNLTKKDLSPDGSDNVEQTDVEFETNIGTEGTPPGFQDDDGYLRLKQKIRANKQSRSSRDFWVVYQLGAFQPHVGEDGDPMFGPNSYGSTIGLVVEDEREAGSILYRETVRDHALDFSDKIAEIGLWPVTSVRQSGRMFDMIDSGGDGSLMTFADVFSATSAEKVEALVFSGAGLRKIITKSYPGAKTE